MDIFFLFLLDWLYNCFCYCSQLHVEKWNGFTSCNTKWCNKTQVKWYLKAGRSFPSHFLMADRLQDSGGGRSRWSYRSASSTLLKHQPPLSLVADLPLLEGADSHSPPYSLLTSLKLTGKKRDSDAAHRQYIQSPIIIEKVRFLAVFKKGKNYFWVCAVVSLLPTLSYSHSSEGKTSWSIILVRSSS